jgi:hypothetical protein
MQRKDFKLNSRMKGNKVEPCDAEVRNLFQKMIGMTACDSCHLAMIQPDGFLVSKKTAQRQCSTGDRAGTCAGISASFNASVSKHDTGREQRKIFRRWSSKIRIVKHSS